VEENNLTDDGSKNLEGGQEESEEKLMQKKTLIIAGIVISLFIIGVIAVPVILPLPPQHGTTQSPVINNFTQPETGLPAARTTSIPQTIPRTPVRTISETVPVKSKAVEPVDFSIQTGVPVSCGLTCRQLDAMLINSGYSTAHNVCITVSMHNSRNEIINLNGELSLNRCIGDVAGGQMITSPITINADCGPFASLCIGETLTLQTLVVSDEKTVRFPDQVISV
jgi:hypothetical protein